MNKKIDVNVYCDGFGITVNDGKEYWFGQEVEKYGGSFKELFESLGCVVNIEEIY